MFLIKPGFSDAGKFLGQGWPHILQDLFITCMDHQLDGIILVHHDPGDNTHPLFVRAELEHYDKILEKADQYWGKINRSEEDYGGHCTVLSFVFGINKTEVTRRAISISILISG